MTNANTTIENIRNAIAARLMQAGLAEYTAAHEISAKALENTKPETEYDQATAQAIEAAFLSGLKVFSPLVGGPDVVLTTKIGANYFASSHLPEPLKNISKRFYWLAYFLTRTLPDGEQKEVTLRHLLIAKDAAVRATLKPASGGNLSGPFEL